MKSTTKKLISLLLVIFTLSTLTITAFAITHSRSLTVGNTYSLAYSDTPYQSTDESVIQIRHDGDFYYTAVAVGEGTATVYGGVWANMPNPEYSFTVKSNETYQPITEPSLDDTVVNDTNVNNTDSYDDHMNSIDKQMEENSKKFDEIQESRKNEFNEKAESIQAEHDEMYEQTQNTIEKGFTFTGIMFVVIIIIWIVALLSIIIGVIYIFIEAPKCGMSRAWALLPLVSSFLGIIIFIVIRTKSKERNGTLGTSGRKITCPTCGGTHPDGTETCSICGTKL